MRFISRKKSWYIKEGFPKRSGPRKKKWAWKEESEGPKRKKDPGSGRRSEI